MESGIYSFVNKRKQNEDVAFVSLKSYGDSEVLHSTAELDEIIKCKQALPYRAFACLLDGMGGLDGDKVAVVKNAAARYYNAQLSGKSYIETTDEIATDIMRQHCGSTLCRCVLDENNNLEYNWIGDSRIYIYKKDANRIFKLTSDNNMAACSAQMVLSQDGQDERDRYLGSDEYASKKHELFAALGRDFVDTARDMYERRTYINARLCDDCVLQNTFCVLARIHEKCCEQNDENLQIDFFDEIKAMCNECHINCDIIANRIPIIEIHDICMSINEDSDLIEARNRIAEQCMVQKNVVDYGNEYLQMIQKFVSYKDRADRCARLVLSLQSGSLRLAEGDIVIMCSDGAYDKLSDDEILALLNRFRGMNEVGAESLNSFCEAMCRISREKYDSRDNQTVVCFVVPNAKQVILKGESK